MPTPEFVGEALGEEPCDLSVDVHPAAVFVALVRLDVEHVVELVEQRESSVPTAQSITVSFPGGEGRERRRRGGARFVDHPQHVDSGEPVGPFANFSPLGSP